METTMHPTRKIWILVGLLAIATVFWILSERYYGESRKYAETHRKTNQQATTGEPISDIEIQSRIDSALMKDTELELKAIDEEF